MANDRSGDSILLITPPFCQLNTPYPATAFLKGMLNTYHIRSHQVDLGIEVIDRLFSADGFEMLFTGIESSGKARAPFHRRMISLREHYTGTINAVMEFLRGSNPELAHRICSRQWLPEGSRFSNTSDLRRDFGRLGIHDQAKHLATLYIEEIADLITTTIDPHFGFSRYAEKLGRYANSFSELESELASTNPDSLVVRIMLELLKNEVESFNPSMVAITIPFPGNLFSAFKCGQWVKKFHPDIQVAIGGGFVNTELRNVTDERVFGYVDWVVVDGEWTDSGQKVTGKRMERGWEVNLDCSGDCSGGPDYEGLRMEKYFSVLEMANPMHRLWSDGRWLKLMLAHGCYWGKCSFCDVTLDYIKNYKPNRVTDICDQMERLMAQTGCHGFHFTDEAAPPVLLRELALEILRRRLTVTWWTNIRFEKMFTYDLCRLLRASGCIAVSGGLEVASPRILKLINKGVTVEQVTRVAANFTRSGIMVHAYLMYGFPTQTARETIDSLEVVRQLFKHGIVQSGFWHRFALTAHSPVGQDPERFSINIIEGPPATFALNDLEFSDPSGCDHEMFGEGLRKALYNYMHGICFHFPLREWFDFKIPEPSVSPGFVQKVLESSENLVPRPDSRLIWTGALPEVTYYSQVKKGKARPRAKLHIQTSRETVTVGMREEHALWLLEMLRSMTPETGPGLESGVFQHKFTETFQEDFQQWWQGNEMEQLRSSGLLVV